MVLTYDDGQIALLDSTLLAKTDCIGIIQGETGQIKIHSRFHENEGLTLYQDDQEPTVFEYKRTTHGYDYEIQHVMQCLTEGRTESPVWSLDDSLTLMDLLDTIRAEAGIVY